MRRLVPWLGVLVLAGCPKGKPPTSSGAAASAVEVDAVAIELRERYLAMVADARVDPADEVYPEAGDLLLGCEIRTAVQAGLIQIFVLCDPGVLIDSRLYDPPGHDATVELIAAQAAAEGMSTSVTRDELAGLPLSALRAEPGDSATDRAVATTLLLSNSAAEGMPQVVSCAFLSGPDPAGQEAWCRRAMEATLVAPGPQMDLDDRFIQIQLPPRDGSESGSE